MDEIVLLAASQHETMRRAAIACGRIAGVQVALGGDLDHCCAVAHVQFESALHDAPASFNEELTGHVEAWYPVIRLAARCFSDMIAEQASPPSHVTRTEISDDTLEQRMAQRASAERAVAVTATGPSLLDQ